MRRGICLLAGLLCAAQVLMAVDKTVVAPVVRGKMTLDGNLTDSVWKTCPARSDFRAFQKDETVNDTKVRFAHDDKWLYLGLECENREPGYDLNAEKKHDGEVSRDDSVEIFISSDTDRASYGQFMLNCDNVKAEQFVIGKGAARRSDRAWRPTWLSSVAKSDRGWDAEIAIPLYLFAKDGKIANLSLNVARTKIVPERDEHAVRFGEKRQLSTLFPVADSFHDPETFGELTGLETANVLGLGPLPPKIREDAYPCLLKLDDAVVESYYMKDGKTFYDVFAKVSYGGPVYNWSYIGVVDKAESGKKAEVFEKTCVSVGRQERVKLSIPVADIENRTVTVVLKDYFTQGVVDQLTVSNLEKLTPLDAFFSRNYYTSEKQAELFCAVSLPPETLKGAKLIVKNDASEALFRFDAITSENLLPLDLAKFSVGAHQLSVELANEEGKSLFKKLLTLTKRAPRPGFEWKIDQLNGVLLNNGEPLFPFGIALDRYTDKKMKAMKDMGFNMFVRWSGVFPDDILDRSAANGLYVVGPIETFVEKRKIPELSKYLSGEEFKKANENYSLNKLQSVLNYGYPAFKKLTRSQRNDIFESLYREELPGMLANVKALSEHKNVMGYFSFDEPGFAGFDMFVQGRDLYKRTNEIDGYHPTIVNYSSHIPAGTEATDWCDILCTDPYWIPDGTLKDRSSINFLSKIVWITRQRADAARKMTWIVPVGSYWSASHRRSISPVEQMCQSYLCVIHGARAVTYYMLPEQQVLRDAIKAFGEQLKVLAPAILAPKVKQEIVYSPVEFNPEKDSFPAVQVALFQYPNGDAALLAANTTERQVNTTYALSCLPEQGEVKRLFSQDARKVSNGTFVDSLEPFGVRAYAIPVGGKPLGPTKINVKSEIDESVPVAVRSETVDYYGRKGRKNFAPNPSFEEATIPDMPDYYRPIGKTVVGGEDGHWKLVETDPYDGKRCLQLTNRPDNAQLNYVGFLLACAPQSPEMEQYTWSIYMKGDRDGIEALFGCHDMRTWNGDKWVPTWKTVKLTKEWKRYAVAGPIPANVDRKCGLELQVRGYGTVWLDAVQLEKTPTAFEP